MAGIPTNRSGTLNRLTGAFEPLARVSMVVAPITFGRDGRPKSRYHSRESIKPIPNQ